MTGTKKGLNRPLVWVKCRLVCHGDNILIHMRKIFDRH